MTTISRRVARKVIAIAFSTLPEWFRLAEGRDLLLTCEERFREQTKPLSYLHCAIRDALSLIFLSVHLRCAPPRRGMLSNSRNSRPSFMDTLHRDISFALRGFARRPAFTALVVMTFALGIAATTAMYSVVDAVLVRPIDAPDANRLASIYPTYPDWRSNERLAEWWDRGTFTWPGFVEYKRTQQSFSSIAAFTVGTSTIVGVATPEQIGVGLATPELFALLGAQPIVGRLLVADDPAEVVVLDYSFWRSRFGADPGVVGRAITLGARTFTIVGVLQSGFEVTRYWHAPGVLDAAVWRLIVPDGSSTFGPNNGFLSVLGRLRPEVTFDQANLEASVLIPAAMSRRDLNVGGRVAERIADQTSTFREPLMILIGASAVLLFAACTSVAAMLLGAGMDREPEITLRAALGAGRVKLVRQLMTEGIMLGIVGGALGVTLSTVALKAFVLTAPARMPGLANASVDGRILIGAVGVSLIFALLFTIAPALVMSRVNLAGTATVGRVARGSRDRFQQSLIIGELALATVLLLGAGLLTRTMYALETVDPGFTPEGLLTMRVSPSTAQFNYAGDPLGYELRVTAYYDRLVAALRALPGVQDVAIAGVLPFSGEAGSNEVKPEGVSPAPGEILDAERRPVTANYFDVMKMHIVAGRGFTSADNRSDASRVVVVNEEMVRRYWPGETGVGKRLGFWDQEWTVVGVVRNTRESDLRGERSTKFYVPAARLGSSGGSLIVRTTGDPSVIAGAVRPAVWSVDPTLAVTSVVTMRERMGETVAEQRYRMRLMIAFSVLAVTFAIAGVYGVLSRSVARRRRELGIRTALGALRRDVILMVLKNGVALGVIGVAIGLLAGYFGTRVLESMLYDTQRNDPLTLVGIVLLVLLLTLIAAWRPASRAAGVEPMSALNAE